MQAETLCLPGAMKKTKQAMKTMKSMKAPTLFNTDEEFHNDFQTLH